MGRCPCARRCRPPTPTPAWTAPRPAPATTPSCSPPRLSGTLTLAQGQLVISSNVTIDGDTDGDGTHRHHDRRARRQPDLRGQRRHLARSIDLVMTRTAARRRRRRHSHQFGHRRSRLRTRPCRTAMLSVLSVLRQGRRHLERRRLAADRQRPYRATRPTSRAAGFTSAAADRSWRATPRFRTTTQTARAAALRITGGLSATVIDTTVSGNDSGFGGGGIGQSARAC